MRHYNIPIFLPELACPHRCVYCNQFHIAGQQKITTTEEVKNIIERHMESFTEAERYVEVAFFGGNFTGLPCEMQDEYLNIVEPYLRQGLVQSLRCSTRPDYIAKERLKVLKEKGMLHIELGAQSTDNEVLRTCRRGHDFESIKRASELIIDEGFVLGLQMMTGLPGDTFEKTLKTASDIVALGAKETRIYPCVVVKDTPLEKLFRNGKYEPLTISEAVKRSAVLYEFFNKNKVKVLRMGLHPSEELESEAFVAGPYHKNFAEMVFSEIWRQRLESINMECNGVEIEVNPTQRNFVFGWRSANKAMLLKRFKTMKVTDNDNLKPDEFIAKPLTDRPKVIISDSRMPEQAKAKLETFGEVLWLEPSDMTYESISAHPDIFFFQNHNHIVAAPNTPTEWINILKDKGVNLVFGEKEVGLAHPDTAHYNAVSTGNTLIHNLKITDNSILNLFGKRIHVNQAYTRCNLLFINRKSCITSDMGIYRVLKDKGFDVFFADPSTVELRGHKNGFFPGCCGLFGNTLFVCGSIANLTNGDELSGWLKKHKTEVVELYSGKLVDVGGILFL